MADIRVNPDILLSLAMLLMSPPIAYACTRLSFFLLYAIIPLSLILSFIALLSFINLHKVNVSPIEEKSRNAASPYIVVVLIIGVVFIADKLINWPGGGMPSGFVVNGWILRIISFFYSIGFILALRSYTDDMPEKSYRIRMGAGITYLIFVILTFLFIFPWMEM